MSGLIAVTGATGVVGRRVAVLLAERGIRQRLVVRDPSRAPNLPGAEVRQIASYGAGDDVHAALDGIDTLFLVPGAESENRRQQHLTAVDAAVAAGVRRIVYLSFVDARPDATFTLVRDHWATEERIRSSGVAWTFPRMNLYLDFLPFMVSQVAGQGVIEGPAGDGRAAVVARADLAAAVTALLTADDADGETYDLTGPEAITLGEAAEQMARAAGRPVVFRDQTVEEAYASRASYGAPDWQVTAWVSTYTAIATGELAHVSDAVPRLTGRPATSLADYLERRPGALRHLTASS
ncbi:MAG: SDR family oxidoreductase [Mycobacteriales bacterium]